MKKRILSLMILLLMFSTASLKEAEACNWWGRLWTDCEEKTPKDFACYGTVVIAIEVEGPGGAVQLDYQEVHVMTGNRIDCMAGESESGCSEESKC